MKVSVFGRLVAGTAAAAAIVVLFFLAFGAAPTASAAGGPTCFDLMTPGATPQVITLASASYTLTIPTGSEVCVESGSDLLLGFLSTNPFAVDGHGASMVPAPGSGFLYAEGPIVGTLTYNITASEVVKLEVTGKVGEKATVWLGSLQSAPAVVSTPVAASATTMQVVGPGPLAKGAKPEWSFTVVTGTMTLEIEGRKPFTATTEVDSYPAASCGVGCWKSTVPTDEGLIHAPELNGWGFWATLVGAPDARVLVPAPAAVASPASAKPPGGGGATGAAPEVWGAAPKIIGPTLPRGWGWALN